LFELTGHGRASFGNFPRAIVALARVIRKRRPPSGMAIGGAASIPGGFRCFGLTRRSNLPPGGDPDRFDWNLMSARLFLGIVNAQEPAMQNGKNLKELFTETLKDIYFAEKQILRALPKMAKQAESPELKQAFETHRDQTEGHVERLNEVFEQLGRPARGKTCEAILGIIDEAKEIMEEFKGADALDAGLASSAQAVEHYEIARYGTLKTWALQLGLNDAAKLLDETLQEEIQTDKLLTKLATSSVNKKAA
jgi:ferritin-like metal-binding protein YciE